MALSISMPLIPRAIYQAFAVLVSEKKNSKMLHGGVSSLYKSQQ